MKEQILLILLSSFILLSCVQAENFGYNYLEGDLDIKQAVNYTTKNVNKSDYWDNLDTPADINAGDINDDGTYLTSETDPLWTGNYSNVAFLNQDNYFNWYSLYNISNITAKYLDVTDKSTTDTREADISTLNIQDKVWRSATADISCYDSYSFLAETYYMGLNEDIVAHNVFLDGTEYYITFTSGNEAGNTYPLRDRLYADEDSGAIDCDIIALSTASEPDVSNTDGLIIFNSGGSLVAYQDYVNISKLYTSTIDGVNSLAVQDDIAIGGATSGAPLAIEGTEALGLGLMTMTYEPQEYYSNHAGIYGDFANVVKDFSTDFDFLTMYYATGTGVAYESPNPIHEHGFLFNHLPPSSEDANITLVGYGGMRDVGKEIRFANSSGNELFVLDAQPDKTEMFAPEFHFLTNGTNWADIHVNSTITHTTTKGTDANFNSLPDYNNLYTDGKLNHTALAGMCAVDVELTNYSAPYYVDRVEEVCKWERNESGEYEEVCEDINFKVKKYETYVCEDCGVDAGCMDNQAMSLMKQMSEAGRPVKYDNKTILTGQSAMYDEYLTNTTKDEETIAKVEDIWNIIGKLTYEELKGYILDDEGSLADSILTNTEKSSIGSYNIGAIAHFNRAMNLLLMWKVRQQEDRLNQIEADLCAQGLTKYC